MSFSDRDIRVITDAVVKRKKKVGDVAQRYGIAPSRVYQFVSFFRKTGDYYHNKKRGRKPKVISHTLYQKILAVNKEYKLGSYGIAQFQYHIINIINWKTKMTKLRIVSWNCNTTFRAKFAELIKQYNPDILIIPECENPKHAEITKVSQKDEDEYKLYNQFAVNYEWIIGSRDTKGLGIFAKPGIKLKRLHWPNTIKTEEKTVVFNYYLPVRVNDEFTLVACWPGYPYINNVSQYLELNADKIDNNTILAGDFNSSVAYDIQEHHKKFTCLKMMAFLKEKGIESAYHLKTNEVAGKETTPTYYQEKDMNQPFFIDYCFLNPAWLVDFEIGSVDLWGGKKTSNPFCSDHMPLIIDIDTEK